jgi:hypothetical protein
VRLLRRQVMSSGPIVIWPLVLMKRRQIVSGVAVW